MQIPFDGIHKQPKFVRDVERGRPYSAIVYKEGDQVIAENWKGRKIAEGEAGVDDAEVINSALNTLTSGRTWKEKVTLVGDFIVSDTIVLPSYTILDLTQAKISLADGTNKPPLSLSAVEEIDVFGGVIDGNKANQTSYPTGVRGVINIADCQNVNVNRTKILNGYQDGIYVLFSTSGKKNVELFNVIVENPNQDGIFYDTGNLDLDVDSVIFKPVVKNAGDNPINLSDLQGVRVYNPIVISPTSALRIDDCQDCKIINPIIRDPTSHGIVIESIRRTVGKNKIIGGEITSSSANANNGIYIKQSQDNYMFDVTVYNFANCFRVDSAGTTPEVRRNIIESCIADTPGSYAFSTGGLGGDNIFRNCKVLNLGTATAFYLTLTGDKAEKYTIDGTPSWNHGTATFSGDAATTQFTIAHGLVSTPSVVKVIPQSADAAGDFYVTADATNIYVNYITAPASGTNNVVLYWEAEV